MNCIHPRQTYFDTKLPCPVRICPLVLAGAVWFVVAANHEGCSKKSCPPGQSPKLMDHACLCVTEAK